MLKTKIKNRTALGVPWWPRVWDSGLSLPWPGINTWLANWDPTSMWCRKNMCVCVCVSVCDVLVAQSCPILWDPMDCSPPGSSVHGISQARILEWVAISDSRGIFPTQGWNSCLLHWQAGYLYRWATREAHSRSRGFQGRHRIKGKSSY